MQGLRVNINNLNPGVRYKFIRNDGVVFSGNFNRSYLTLDTPPERFVVFDNCINETIEIGQGSMHIPVNFIGEIYAVVSAPSLGLPSSLGRYISFFGGRRNTKRKRQKSKKQKRKNKKTKRRRQKSGDENDDVCPICQEKFNAGDEIITTCGGYHKFHRNEIIHWCRGKNFCPCPICKQDIRHNVPAAPNNPIQIT